MKERDRRESILDAAGKLSVGGRGFTLDELASAVGVSRVTLYRYFRGKKAILEALSSERGQEIKSLDEPDIHTKILLATRVVMGRVGPISATIEDIAKEAGVGAATVYRRFGSKEQLFREFMETLGPRRSKKELFFAKGHSFEESLLKFTQDIIQAAHENKDIILWSLQAEVTDSELFKDMRHSPLRTSTRLKEFFEEAMDRGELKRADPMQLAWAFSGLVMSFAFFIPTMEGIPLKDPARTSQFIVSLFLRGSAPLLGRQNEENP